MSSPVEITTVYTTDGARHPRVAFSIPGADIAPAEVPITSIEEFLKGMAEFLCGSDPYAASPHLAEASVPIDTCLLLEQQKWDGNPHVVVSLGSASQRRVEARVIPLPEFLRLLARLQSPEKLLAASLGLDENLAPVGEGGCPLEITTIADPDNSGGQCLAFNIPDAHSIPAAIPNGNGRVEFIKVMGEFLRGDGSYEAAAINPRWASLMLKKQTWYGQPHVAVSVGWCQRVDVRVMTLADFLRLLAGLVEPDDLMTMYIAGAVKTPQ